MTVDPLMLRSRLLTAGNAKALSLALLFFVYTILVLSTAKVQYLETLHRVTVQGVFDQNLFGSTFADVIAVVGLSLLYVALSLRSIVAKVFSFIIFADCIILFLLVDLGQGLVLIGLITLPVVLVLSTSAYLVRREVPPRSERVAIETMQVRTSSTRSTMRAKESKPARFERRRWYSEYSELSIDGRKVAIAFLLIIIVIEAGAIIKWASLPALPSANTNLNFYDKNDPTWKFASLESALYHSFALLSPVLLVLLTFAFLYKHFDIPNRIRARFRARFVDVEKPVVNATIETRVYPSKPTIFASIPSWVLLAVALAISVSLAIYPNLPGLNPAGSGISTDEQFYVDALADLRTPDMPASTPGLLSDNAIGAAFRLNDGDRPWSLLLMLALGNLTGLPDVTIVRFLPVLLAPGLVAASYVLARNAGWISNGTVDADQIEAKRTRERFAGLLAVLAALSPQIVVGIYGGFLANWLALIPAIFAMLFLIRIWNHYTGWTNQSRGNNEIKNRFVDYRFLNVMINAYGLFLTLVLAMLFHAYTWGFVIVAIGLFLVVSVILSNSSSRPPRRSIVKISILIVLVIGSTIMLDYAKAIVFATPSGAGRDVSFATNFLNVGNFNSRWETLSFTANEFLGGFLANPILLIAALVWIVFQGNYKLRTSDRILFCMFFVLSVPILFGNTVLQARVIYDIPLFIPTALILFSRLQSRGEPKEQIFSNVLLLVIVLALAAYALRALANFYLVLPAGFELERPFLVP